MKHLIACRRNGIAPLRPAGKILNRLLPASYNPHVRSRSFSILLLLLLLFPASAYAQSEKPERLVVDSYSYAFTFDRGSVVTYAEGSNGATGICFPEGAATTEDPLYRVLVYGMDDYLVSLAEARDSGIDPPKEQFLKVSDFGSPAAWDAQFTKIMATHGREPSGSATVMLSDGSRRSVPYFSWSRTIGSRTHYALMYVTTHRDAFIAVQVEGARPFSEDSLASLTDALELILPEPAAADPAPEA